MVWSAVEGLDQTSMQHNRIDTNAWWQLLKLLPNPPPRPQQQQQQHTVGVVCICTRCLPRTCQRAISTCPSSHSELCPEVLRLMCVTFCQRSRHRLRLRLRPRGRCQAVGQRLRRSAVINRFRSLQVAQAVSAMYMPESHTYMPFITLRTSPRDCCW